MESSLKYKKYEEIAAVFKINTCLVFNIIRKEAK